MNSQLKVTVLGLALVMTSGVNAYDPMPDPRMSPVPPATGSTQPRSENPDADSGGYGARSNDRTRRRGEPEFGSSSRRGSGYEYGSGARRGN